MNIVFMGSAQFGIPALEKILQRGHIIKGIVSTPAKEKGRGLKIADSPVVEFAAKNGISPVLTPQNLKSPEFVDSLKKIQADLFVVVAFRILPREVFNIPSLGTINIHAALLPKYRGPAPIQRAIEAGEKKTGITIFRIDDGIDTGNIILKKETAIGDFETAPDLYDRLSILGAEGLMEALDNLSNNTVSYSRQEHAGATAAPKLLKAEGNIDWRMSARTIFNKIRAFKPFPGTYTFFNGKRLNVEWAEPVDIVGQNKPGEIFSTDANGFNVQCGEGGIRILEVKPEGKKSMSAGSFLAGRKIIPSACFDMPA